MSNSKAHYRNYWNDGGNLVQLRCKLQSANANLLFRISGSQHWMYLMSNLFFWFHKITVRNNHCLNMIYVTSIVFNAVSERRSPVERWRERKGILGQRGISCENSDNLLITGSKIVAGDPSRRYRWNIF